MLVTSGLKKKLIFHESLDVLFALSLGAFFLCPILYQICTKLQPKPFWQKCHFFTYKNDTIMERSLFLAIFLLLGSLLFTCTRQNDTIDIRNYYFPLKELEEGMVYEYAFVGNDSVAPDYWYYRSLIQDGKKYLTSTLYRPGDLSPQIHAREVMVKNGMLLEEITFFEKDTSGKPEQLTVPVKIVAGNVYPFYVHDPGGVFLVRLEWTWKQDTLDKTVLIKNRRFAGSTNIEVEGKKYEAVKFGLKEAVEMHKNGILAPPPYPGDETYAKGIGRVHYRKFVGDLSLEYKLVKRYPMAELEKKFKKMQ